MSFFEERNMTAEVAGPEIGQWYVRTDKGEPFQVVGRDTRAGTIEIQSFDGDLDEIDDETWATLPIEQIVPPEDWTGPVDDVETDDLGYSDTGMSPKDWARPLQPLRVDSESWQDTGSDDERDPLGEGAPVEAFIASSSESRWGASCFMAIRRDLRVRILVSRAGCGHRGRGWIPRPPG